MTNLPEEKGKMFLNRLYTDGYTCRISFSRRKHLASNAEKVSLVLHGFTTEEIDIEEASRIEEDEDRLWKKKIKMWRNVLKVRMVLTTMKVMDKVKIILTYKLVHHAAITLNCFPKAS